MSSNISKPPGILGFEFLFPALAVGRLLLCLTNLSEVLKYDHQLSSPLTAYSHLQEGVYLFENGIDPYSGGIFRHSPLYLSLFTTILPNSRSVNSVLWTVCDIVGAWALVQIWRTRQQVSSSSRDSLVAAIYLMNPYIILPNAALSTSSVENTLALLAFMFASKGKKSATLLLLAFLVHSNITFILLLVPLSLVLLTDPLPHLATPKAISIKLQAILPLVVQYGVYFAILTFLSTWSSGGWSWVSQTWGTSLTLPDLTPNPGLWWYFFTEMFDHFRPFFLMVFSVHLLIYIAPICIKFQYDPLYATHLLVGVIALFKAYPTLSDPGLFLSMIALFPESYPFMRHPIVTTLLHLHASLLLPLFHHLWLVQGTGNANFFYASTLVFACANGAALIDCIWAGLRIAIGEEVKGYVVVQE
ncbi:GPI transamidase subunit PIG-U [Infundibulicybe gibba]|nr:GPI transamidase subunit PIG-U [Infundibulicybe gibba]